MRITTVDAWHFLPEDRRPRWGSRDVIEVGSTLRVDPPLELCRHGLHASRRAIDALEYAPGPVICRVRLSGEVFEDGDKLCATQRTVLSMADATGTLHEFACRCAERALEAAKVEDPRCRGAIEAKRRWLRGEATDEELAAAWAAARDAAWDAARGAARDAARDAAWAAAWDAARGAARDAARAAAWDAAWDAARAAQNELLESMFVELLSLNTTEAPRP